MILLDYMCDTCGTLVESLERRPPPPDKPCPCGGRMARQVCAPMIKQPMGWVTPGTSQERPPDAIDTRAIAEGMPVKEWRERRRKSGARRDEVRRQFGVAPKVFV